MRLIISSLLLFLVTACSSPTESTENVSNEVKLEDDGLNEARLEDSGLVVTIDDAKKLIINGISLGFSKQEVRNTLGNPDETDEEEELNSDSAYIYLLEDRNTNPMELNVAFYDNHVVSITFDLSENPINENWYKDLGEPFDMPNNHPLFYLEGSEQLLWFKPAEKPGYTGYTGYISYAGGNFYNDHDLEDPWINSNEKEATVQPEQIKWFNTIAEMEFETPTNQGVTVTTEKLQSGITYPKISLPTSKTVETKINQIFYNEALNAQAVDKDAKEMQSEQKASGSWSPVFGDYGVGLSYTVPFNQEGFISVIVARTANGFGMGTNSLQHNVGTFDLQSGEQLALSAC